ncbi:hypothetical protein Anapl_08902 [Anas platyrhynchos]|uniref:Uncharacterized protein n=1 Tax=Anas platyrhynchos TaxID=8839 RepID=R0LFH6_ANAPL|nr:hypothetical protein Anapl_08902 [Anas platyrhynchos]
MLSGKLPTLCQLTGVLAAGKSSFLQAAAATTCCEERAHDPFVRICAKGEKEHIFTSRTWHIYGFLEEVVREAMEGEMLRVAGRQQNIEQRDCIRQGQKHTVVLRIKLMKRDRVSVQERLRLRYMVLSLHTLAQGVLEHGLGLARSTAERLEQPEEYRFLRKVAATSTRADCETQHVFSHTEALVLKVIPKSSLTIAYPVPIAERMELKTSRNMSFGHDHGRDFFHVWNFSYLTRAKANESFGSVWGALAVLHTNDSCRLSVGSTTFGVLKVTKEKETKSPLLAQTERAAGKTAQADGLQWADRSPTEPCKRSPVPEQFPSHSYQYRANAGGKMMCKNVVKTAISLDMQMLSNIIGDFEAIDRQILFTCKESLEVLPVPGGAVVPGAGGCTRLLDLACKGGGSKQDKENYPLLKELNQLRDGTELSASNWHRQRDIGTAPGSRPRRSWLRRSHDTRQGSKFGSTSKLTPVARDNLGSLSQVTAGTPEPPRSFGDEPVAAGQQLPSPWLLRDGCSRSLSSSVGNSVIAEIGTVAWNEI